MTTRLAAIIPLPSGSKTLREPYESLFRIQRALAGHVSYLAACDVNVAFSEYLLYEPILRVLANRGFKVECEVRCPGMEKTGNGDFKRIDFVATKGRVRFALEVKWPRVGTPMLKVNGDAKKLEKFEENEPRSASILCVFGRRTHIERLPFSPNRFRDLLPPQYAMLHRTQFGCRILGFHS